MKEPARTLIGEIERVVSALPDAVLFRGVTADGLARFQTIMRVAPPPGLAAFLAVHDGGLLGPETRLLTMDEALARVTGTRRTAGISSWPAGLWPLVDRAGRRYALDAEEANGDGEWPVVEVTEQGVDRVGTSCLRFLHVLCAELGASGAPGESAISLCEARCHRDPGLADHWLDFAELLEPEGRAGEIDATLAAALRAATPPTPALMLAIGMRAVRAGDQDGALRAFSDAIALEPVGARDDDARLDAAALVSVLAAERGDAAAVAAARGLLGEATVATAAFWRGEALAALAEPSEPSGGGKPSFDGEISNVGTLAVRIVGALDPQDQDLAKLRVPTPALREGLSRLQAAREELESGRAEAAVRAARAIVATPAMADLGAAHAFLAEALNAVRSPDAAAVAKRAIELNPALVDGWRELGDAELEAGRLKEGEAAFRQVVAMDATYGLGYAKLAQVLLEQARTLEALEAIGEAGRRGGDPFFIAAIRGDIYAEMERHTDAAEAYDLALAFEPDDHWALHQAALEHGFAGNSSRATELFAAALTNDREGCHQTLIDYGDHLRRLGRIGDAVKLYRRAVAAVPGDPEWKQTLREAERELLAAPN
ncbi:MAG TPA: tetratricopeptide repeat protein [Polyangia bacterium]|jgi:tetratricopeptide (TPR) repeat protein|nr:tetratricopeptide repeat protein [Polyangia bacterium]